MIYIVGLTVADTVEVYIISSEAAAASSAANDENQSGSRSDLISIKVQGRGRRETMNINIAPTDPMGMRYVIMVTNMMLSVIYQVTQTKSHRPLTHCHFYISCSKIMEIENLTPGYVFGHLARKMSFGSRVRNGTVSKLGACFLHQPMYYHSAQVL